MRQRQINIIILALLLFFSNQSSRTQSCGTIPSPDVYNNIPDIQIAKSRNNKIRIPLVFHIIQPLGSSFNLNLNDFQENVKELNKAFALTNMEFFICKLPKYIQGAKTHYNQTSYKLGQTYNELGKINVYVIEELTDMEGDNFYCGLGSIPNSFNINTRRILLVRSCFASSNLFIHEMGHFLGLYHTHNEWEDSELVNGSNCDVSGDYICDTPADPNLAYLPYNISICNYTDSLTDLNGDLYMPDITNYMSYAPPKCRNSFTSQQIEIMNYHATESYQFMINFLEPNFNYSYLAPNIATDGVNLFLKNKKNNTSLKIKVWSLMGQQMKTLENYKSREEKLLYLSTSDLPTGFYLLSVEYGQLGEFKEVETFKFYKSN